METENDYQITENVVKKAFENHEYADGNEHLLVQKLRISKDFIPELSLVAEKGNKIVGHILFSKLTISGVKEYESLSLAPVSVLPEYQNKGIGGKLIETGLNKAKQMGFESVIVLGHKDYYPKFGFKNASKWGIKCSFDVPDEVFMAIELTKDSLSGKSGVVKYPPEFGTEV